MSAPDRIWPLNTCFIVRDSIVEHSIVDGLMEEKMNKNRLIGVRYFSGARIEDFYSYLEPLMKKLPCRLIIHAGTNNTIHNDSDCIIDKLMKYYFHVRQYERNTMLQGLRSIIYVINFVN